MFVLKNKYTALLKKYHSILDEIDTVVSKNYELLRKLEAYETKEVWSKDPVKKTAKKVAKKTTAKKVSK